MTVLRFDRVRFGYADHPVIRDVSFAVAPGEGVALLGPNGAGKSTVIRLAMALEQPQQGTIEVAGLVTRGRAPEDLASRAGILFQDPRLQLVERTVQSEIAFGLRALGWEADRAVRATTGILEQLGLMEVAGSHPYDLPLPTQRLVALGSALVADPSLLLLDEPTAGLDRGSRETVCRVIDQRRQKGTAVVVATHDVGFAIEALDRAVLLDQGHTVADGPLFRLLEEDGAIQKPPAVAVSRGLGFPPEVNRLGEVAAALAGRPVEAP